MGKKSRSGGLKNQLRKVFSDHPGRSRDPRLNKPSETLPVEQPFDYQKHLHKIEYKIKFLHPRYIPKNDPRQAFYQSKLEEYLIKEREIAEYLTKRTS